MKEKNKSNIILYILIVFLSIGLITTIILLINSLNKEPKEKEKIKEYTQTITFDLTEKVEKVWYYMEKASNGYEYPVVNIDNDEVNSLNNMFKERALKSIDTTSDRCENKCGGDNYCDEKTFHNYCEVILYDYKSVDNDNYFTIMSHEKSGVFLGGFGDFYEFYNFSKKDNKRLSNKELFELYNNISETKFLDDFSKFAKNYDDSYSWLDFQKGYDKINYKFDLEKMHLGMYDENTILLEFVKINDGSMILTYDGNSFKEAKY